MGSYENFNTESIWSKEHVYGVSYFWDLFGSSFDQVDKMFSLLSLLSDVLNNLSVCWFSHILLKFYSGRAVDIWSCFFFKWGSVFWFYFIRVNVWSQIALVVA